MMVRLDISGRDTMFICQVRVFFPSNTIFKQDRGCEWEPEFLEYGTGLEGNVTCW